MPKTELLAPLATYLTCTLSTKGSQEAHIHLYFTGRLVDVTPSVTLFPNYLYYKLSQASSVMVDQVIEVQSQNSKLGARI
jgi:hypothetical protein